MARTATEGTPASKACSTTRALPAYESAARTYLKLIPRAPSPKLAVVIKGYLALAYQNERVKEGVASALLVLGYWRGALGTPALRKSVLFTAHVFHRFDSQDNLRACLKAAVDGLVECGVLSDDRDSAGHLFEYRQVVDRARPGVEIQVRIAP